MLGIVHQIRSHVAPSIEEGIEDWEGDVRPHLQINVGNCGSRDFRLHEMRRC